MKIHKVFIQTPMNLVWKAFACGGGMNKLDFKEGGSISLKGREGIVKKIEKARQIVFTINYDEGNTDVTFNFYPEPAGCILEVILEIAEAQELCETFCDREKSFWKGVILEFKSFVASEALRMA